MVTITVDGRTLEVPAGSLLIQAAEENGTYIPRFCWHKRMKPVGMCRMCLVEVEGPRGKNLVTSCTTPVGNGMVVDTRSDVVTKAQEGILEFLLINHPLDCPVCDRGGECPLQDQVMAHGPGESRFVEEKRHYEKPIEISELVLLDRERCILCARCTRFSEEVSGDPLIEFTDRGYGTQVLTFPDEPFRSYFSGNTVQICPVGALTARPYRFRARPWDLTAVEGTCTHCAVGCRISVQASQNQVLRFLGVDNDPTNWGWLCDKGRFGFEFIGSGERLTAPLIKEAGEFREASWAEALDLVADKLAAIKSEHGGDTVAGLGGARGSNEDAYAFAKFMRSVVGTNHLDAQLGDGLDPQFLAACASRATIDDLDRARTIVVWGPDLKEELPVLYLRVRHAAQEGARLIVVHPRATGLDDVADHVVRYVPGGGPEILERIKSGDGDLAAVREALDDGPVVALVGRAGLVEDPRLAEAVAAVIRELPEGAVLPLARRGNVFGALDMGVAPTLLPGRVSLANEEGRAAFTEAWGALPEGTGRDAAAILSGLADGALKALILCGADPARDFPEPDLAVRALEESTFTVALDLFLTDSSERADVVFPVEGLAETEGSATNLEGRVQKLARVVPGPGQSRPDWAVLEDLAERMGAGLGATSAEAVAKEIATHAPAYGGITWDLLETTREGVVVPGPDGTQPLQYVPVDAGLSPRKARMVLHLARTLYDDGVHVRFGPSLQALAPGGFAAFNPEDATRLGVRTDTVVRVSTKLGEADLPARIDPTLSEGTVYVPSNQETTAGLGAALEVRVEVLAS